MPTITNFTNIRLNNSWNYADVKSYGHSHCDNAFYMVAYEFSGKTTDNKHACRVIQVRRKEYQVATFVQMYDDIELPEWWQDSELVYEWREAEENENSRSTK